MLLDTPASRTEGSPEGIVPVGAPTLFESQIYTTKDLARVEPYYQKFMKARIDLSDRSCMLTTTEF